MKVRCLNLAMVLAASAAFAGEAAPAPGVSAGGVTVLCNDSYLRGYMAFRTPVQMSKDGQLKVCLEPVGKNPKPLPTFQSPLPPADWMQADFDDSSWERQRAPVELMPAGATGHSQSAAHWVTVNSLICLRGRFVVDDPTKVQDLRLSVEYVGGVVVYVNGQEVTRNNLPEGELKADTQAEKYPDDLYSEPGGLFLQDIKKNPAGFERRYRKLTDVVVPAKLLKKGTNILALEFRRAPINEAAVEAKRVADPGGMYVVPGIWAYVGVKNLSLTAASGSAVAANVARPKGVQVWNCAPFETLNTLDYGDGGDPLPVSVAATRNSVFSGRLTVSSDQAIKGLSVSVSDLAQAAGGGKLAASAVRVRYASPAIPADSWVPPSRYDALVDAIPAEIPVGKASAPKEFYLRCGANEGQVLDRKNRTSGALAPLWLTVRVPGDAKPGLYEGTVRLAADGLKPTSVPLRVTVADWRMSDPTNFIVHSFAYHSEDAMAKHYGVPMWSDRHFELMGKSMALMAEINSRQAIANLCINFYGGDKGAVDCSNAQSLIRWIKQADGAFTYDFTLFDKYLDLVAKSVGKPAELRLNCWNEIAIKDGKAVPRGMANYSVTRLDPATGKIEPMEQPTPATEEGFAFWKPVFDAVRKKVEARGWFDVTAVGWSSYCYPPQPEIVSMYKKLWPDGVWGYTAHNGTLNMRFQGKEKDVSMPVRYVDTVWNRGEVKPRGYRALLQPRHSFWCFTWRDLMRDYSSLAVLRSVLEDELMRGQDGISDFGADLFPIKSESGRYYCLGNGRGTGGPSCSTQALLAPGAEGPIATERFEMLRESTELAEAILFVEKALESGKVPAALAAKANRILDERGDAFINNWPDGRLDRDTRLIALAGEIARTLPE